MTLRLVVGRRPKGRRGAWRRSFPRSDRGYRMRHLSDLLANALPRPFRRRNAARQAGSVSWSRAERKHRFPPLYTLYMCYTAKITKTRGTSAAGVVYLMPLHCHGTPHRPPLRTTAADERQYVKEHAPHQSGDDAPAPNSEAFQH